MGCGGSSLQDLSNKAKTAVSEAKNIAETNGLEQAELLNTGKDALVSIKENGANLGNLKEIAEKNGIDPSELVNTGKDLILQSSNLGGEEGGGALTALNQTVTDTVSVAKGKTFTRRCLAKVKA